MNVVDIVFEEEGGIMIFDTQTKKTKFDPLP
jgi:hypothetical protein